MYYSAIFFYLFIILHIVEGAQRVTSSCTKVKLNFGRVRYRQRGRFAKYSCNSGFMLAGERYSTCVAGRWDMPTPKCVRPTCQTVRPPSNGLIYPSHSGAVLHFYCKANFNLRGSNTAYCDGNRWDTNSPTCFPTNQKPILYCNFEDEDICGWTHDVNHDFDWKRQNFNTPSGSIGTGPSFDHTKGAEVGDGYYMYIESSSRNENDTARLISPVFDKTENDTCFEFYYHMYGATIGTLNVYLKKASESWLLNNSTRIFSKRGNQGNTWYRSYQLLGSIDEDYQIVIEGIRGEGYVSDIAIDDVKIIENCVFEENQLSTTTEDFDETVPQIETCENRCGSTKNMSDIENYQIICDCDDNCFDRNSCCPDYIDHCVLDSYSDDYSTTEMMNEMFTSPGMENYSTLQETSVTLPTTTATISTTVTKPVPVSRRTTSVFSTVTPTEQSTKLKLTTTISTTLISNKETRAFAPQTIILYEPTTEYLKEKVIITVPEHIFKESDDTNDVITIPNKSNDDEGSFSVEKVEEEYASKEINIDKDIQKELDPPHVNFKLSKHIYEKSDEAGHKWIIIFGCVGICTMLCGIIITVLVKKYRLYTCKSIKRMQSSNGDSQSDVRFLTSDEIIDFTLAKDYDDF